MKSFLLTFAIGVSAQHWSYGWHPGNYHIGKSYRIFQMDFYKSKLSNFKILFLYT